MKYFSIDNFINKETCKSLINSAEDHINTKNKPIIHGGREFLSSTDAKFDDLINNNKDWKKLLDKINSEKFLHSCLKKFDVVEKFCLVNFFKTKKSKNFQKKIQEISSSIMRLNTTNNLLFYTLYRLYRLCLRKIKFSKLFYPNKSAVELLFDYSKAVNGYSREIHRDSDSRLMVFILYLNSPSKNDNFKGGDFDIYKIIKGNKNVTFPKEKNCKKIDTITPKAGKMIFFLNDNFSFHGVKKMQHHSKARHFIYGGFTLLNRNNPFINNNSKVATEFHLYE